MEIIDQFMLGENILVCPILTSGTFKKDIVFPEGRWKSSDGTVYEEEKTVRVDTPLGKLAWFRKI